MTDKNLLENSVDLVVDEAKFDCFMANGREKNTEETSSVAFGFSKYIWSLENLINDVNFGVFVDSLFAEVNSYLVGTQDYDTTIEKITQQKNEFSKKFLA